MAADRIRSVGQTVLLMAPEVSLSGRTLREFRLRAGLTQAEVVARVRIPSTVLSACESGRRKPSIETAGRIIDAIGFDIHVVRRLDPEAQGRRLVEVLTLAEELPYRPRPLARVQRRGSATQPSPA